MTRRLLLLAVAGLILWRIAALGLSAHYVERVRAGDPAAAGKALAWSDRQPEALLAQGLALREKDPEGARALLRRAYAENPADARPLIALAALARAQGDQAQAGALTQAAVGLAPADPWIQRQVAKHWTFQGDLEKALRHWSLSMEADPKAQQRLLPILLALAEDPRTVPAFKPFAAAPPAWWEAFFAEVAKRALDVEPVRLLYAMRRDAPQATVTEAERQTYVARLRRDGRITEAYIEWVNGLSPAQRAQLGLLHDGGFELEPTNWGFDWHLRSTPSAVIDRARIYGIDGEKALHLLFDRQERRFADVYQPLFLDPGSYRLWAGSGPITSRPKAVSSGSCVAWHPRRRAWGRASASWDPTNGGTSGSSFRSRSPVDSRRSGSNPPADAPSSTRSAAAPGSTGWPSADSPAWSPPRGARPTPDDGRAFAGPGRHRCHRRLP